MDSPSQAWALNSRVPGCSLLGPRLSLLRPRPDLLTPVPFWAACSSTATAGCRPPGGQQGLPSRPPHASAPAPSIPGSACSSARAVSVLWSRVLAFPPGPLPVRLSRVPPCDVSKPCSQRSGRGSSLPPCPGARERSALSRGAPWAPGFPFHNWAPGLGTGERAGLSLGSVAPTLQTAARGLGAHIRVEANGRQIWAPAGPKLEARGLGAGEEKLETTASGGRARSTAGSGSRSLFFFFFFLLF